MAKTDWSIADVVRPQDMNSIGAEINQLRDDVDHIEVPSASLTQPGIVQLSNATDGTREDVAPTEKALGLVMKEAQEGKQAGNERKAQAVAVLIAKGVSAAVTESWDSIISKLTALVIATGNATAADILAGKTAANANGPVTGTMPHLLGIRNATGVAKWGDGALAVYPEKGYQKGGPGDGEIKVSTAQLQTAEPNLISANILSGRPIYGVNGGIPNRSAENNHTPGVGASIWPGDRFFITPPAGYYNGSTWVTAAVPGLTAANLRAGVQVVDIIGTLSEGKQLYYTEMSSVTSININVGFNWGVAFSVAANSDWYQFAFWDPFRGTYYRGGNNAATAQFSEFTDTGVKISLTTTAGGISKIYIWGR